jgi:effector-binding domain-containing protein
MMNGTVSDHKKRPWRAGPAWTHPVCWRDDSIHHDSAADASRSASNASSIIGRGSNPVDFSGALTAAARQYVSSDRMDVMIDTPGITETTAQLTAIIHLTIPRAEMMRVFGPSVAELMATLAAQGLAPAGPVFTHHLRRPTDTFDFELGVPVSAPVVAAGRVKPGQWPVTKVARMVYSGPYEGLPAAWGAFMAWIEAHGHTPTPDLWECYVAGPHSSADPSTWRTELNQPLTG